MSKCIYVDIHKDDDTYEKKQCGNVKCQKVKCIEHEFAKNQSWCCNCKNSIKQPNELPEKCNFLEKNGKWCNNDIIKNNKCIKHAEKEIIGCEFVTRTIQGVKSFCNKEKEENTVFCEKHNKEPPPKKCSKCNTILTDENKSSKGAKCKKCVNAMNDTRLKEKENKLISAGITTKKCEICFEVKQFKDFKNIEHHQCRDCSGVIKNITKEDYLKENSNEIRCCLLCKQEKIITDFSWHTNNFRNQCKECIKDFKYYIQWRIRKREKDPEKYKEYNTEIHRKWVEKNREKFDEYVRIYSKSIEGIIATYLSSAKVRDLFNESDNEEEFKELMELLISQDCFYCGRQIKEGNLKKRIEGNYNGVDRVDSSKSYTLENCVPCCKNCNVMKNTLDIASFLRKIMEISFYNELNDNIDKNFDERIKYHNKTKLIGNSSDFDRYKYEAKKRKKDFELTKKQFNEITKNPCYLCGETNSSGFGIDRFDNNIGYIYDNCRPCCSYCNYMKNNIDYNTFLDQVKKIVDYTVTEKHKELCKKSTFNGMLNTNYYLEENEEDDLLSYLT
jgi:hypothetical protein